MPLDGLSKKSWREKRQDKKIYRAANRVNFLVERLNQAEAGQRLEEKTAPLPQKPPVSEQLPREILEKPPIKKTAVIKLILIIFLILLITGTMYLSELVFSSNGSLNGLNKFNPLKQLASLVTSADKKVAGELDDRINILAMGVGGPGHDGPFLTDTMIIVSVKPSTGEVGLISLPRDMVVKLETGQWVKINEVYSLGRADEENNAAKYVQQIIEDNFNLPIHYYAVISFKGFEEFIDNIGGIMVDVKTGFTDSGYPTDDYKTTTVSFSAGSQYMDGKTALTFARSRHGTNYENSDFKRSERQQLILEAIKDKVFKFSTLLSPQKLSSIYKLLDDYVDTNISIWQAIKIARMVEQTSADKIFRFVLDDSPESLLEPGFTEEGAWILQPKSGNFEAIGRMMNNIFNIGLIKQDGAKIEIQNGTETPGLAYWTTVYLERLGYHVIKYGNAAATNFQKSVIYDLTDGEKKKTLKWLKEELLAYAAKPLPDDLQKQYPNLNATSTAPVVNRPDLIVILGNNFAENFKLPQDKAVATTSTSPIINSSSINIATSTAENFTATTTINVEE